MSEMDSFRNNPVENSYTREAFLEKYKEDPFTQDFMWEKLRHLNLSGLAAGSGSYGIELRGADLTGTDFSHSDLPNADFMEAILRNVNFSGANLQGAVFVQGDIRGANFSSAKLSGVNFHRAIYDNRTIFPTSFNLEKHGMMRR